MRGKVWAGIGAAVIVAAGIGYAVLPHSAADTASAATKKASHTLMHSAIDSGYEKAVKQMGEKRAAELHQMLTRDTIVMDRAAYSEGSGPNLAAEKVMQADYKRLLKMFPAQIRQINEMPQLVTRMEPDSMGPGYAYGNGQVDYLTSAISLIYQAYQSSIFFTQWHPVGTKATAMQTLPEPECADRFALVNRLLFGGEGK
ncbi:hypothetical protein [Alicyclobacillus herbarius]|uniref:hypothetical protein n=1 Tax=Alicyclobacillus herbarius TaxID=122960 RepID=UPI00047A1306|nr:hypothetical protein [Alicyclobacillus herbarius]